MEDHEVLQHLLNLDAEAAALVNDAQAEADRRITEGEKQNQIHHDEVYSREVEILEAAFAREIAAVKETYQQQLDAYRKSLETMPRDMEAFASRAEKSLVPGNS